MLKQKSHLTLAVVLVAATILIAGGVAIASNTGFKINKPLFVVPAGAGSEAGNNWISIPYFHPYTNGNILCTQLGLVSTGLTRAGLLRLNPDGGSLTRACGSAADFFSAPPASLPYQSVRIRNAGTGSPTSAIIVGSHNPVISVTVPDVVAATEIGNLWFAVPYHTTAVTAQDLCNQIGFVQTGLNRGQIGVHSGAPPTGSFTPISCGSAQAGTTNLILGDAVRLRDPNGPFNFVPAHF